ncbi:MAG: TIGR04282 family arsenosugar biosynthesis glycosyltransferase [Rubrivivax sp.]
MQIVIFAKAPVAGLAKTRLIPILGAAGAARLQRSLTGMAVASAVAAQLGPVHLWCAPDGQHRFFRALQRRTGISLHTQVEGDLGRRMLAAFEHHCAAGPVLLIGTDCPALGPGHLRRAAQALMTGTEAVFVPVEDGGYALVGLRQPRARLFSNMSWSTDQVMSQTRNRASAAAIVVEELDMLWDIDRPDDLQRFQAWQALRAMELQTATATLRAPAG